MARKGWYGEKAVKDWLSSSYGKQNVVKTAIGQAIDYIVLKPNKDKILMLVEVKSIHKKKYYLSSNKDQWKRAKALAKEHHIPLYLFVKKPNEPLDIKRIV